MEGLPGCFRATIPNGNLGLGNIDWFQPYKHTNYSVGAIYITIMNLPRSVRLRRENVILVFCLGPGEPKHDINPYIEPLVDELSDLWTGVTLQLTGVTLQLKQLGVLYCVVHVIYMWDEKCVALWDTLPDLGVLGV